MAISGATALIDPPLLSFCVFTYNRALLVNQLLDQIAVVKKAFPQGVIEVIISNNASTDPTVEVVKERYRHDGFKIIGQASNIGLTRHWLQCIKESTGVYVWPYANDDLLDTAAVNATITKHLRQETSDFYHMNYAKGIYLEHPRSFAVMKNIHHGVDCDLIFPNIASLIPYCGIFFRGIVIIGNIFRGAPVRNGNFEGCFALDDIVDHVEILLKIFKHKKCALLQNCLKLHLHPPKARWLEPLKTGMPDSYFWTIGSMRRILRMIRNGTIEPKMIDADGLIHVLKSPEDSYVTVREKLSHHLYNGLLDLMTELDRPLDTIDSSIVGEFAHYLSDAAMRDLFALLGKLGETADPHLRTQLERARGQVDKDLLTVVWQSSSCLPYEKYCNKTVDTSHLGLRALPSQPTVP
jgi:glycosyltransferase involved in cell wall biosynthesis